MVEVLVKLKDGCVVKTAQELFKGNLRSGIGIDHLGDDLGRLTQNEAFWLLVLLRLQNHLLRGLH